MASLTPEELAKTGEVDQELLQIMKSLNVQTPQPKDIFEVRKWFDARENSLVESYGPTPPDMLEHDQEVPVADGSQIRLRITKPKDFKDGPLVVLYHLGGFCVGSPVSDLATSRSLVRSFGAVCVSVGYRLAPEHKFPIPIEDSWTALQWVAENAKTLGADPAKGFILGGTSAGGNAAAVLSHMARDEKLSPPLTGQYLCIPAVLSEQVAEKGLPEEWKPYYFSHHQNANAPVLGQKAVELLYSQYQPDHDDPRFSPYLWLNGHKGLPPAYFQVCGADPLRDEAIVYEMALRQQGGVRTKMDMYPGLPHEFWGMFTTHSQSKKFHEDVVKGFSWLLDLEPQR
ncbi:MAG: hypothetical protein M1820_002872 [Bogoriella megaspora]|nr:MAG: hypothetical protein M1820_002872 [Bogoriella megaspora]